MARHDFYCGVCGQVLVDVNVPAAIGARAGAPEHCGRPTAWIPAVGRMDAANGPGFQAFTTTDGRGNPVTIDSLAKLRAVERESEQAYKNGEGQPMVWRRWAQDRSNQDRPTLGSWDGSEQPTAESKQRFGSTLRKSVEEPDAAYGPGVSDANTSALPKDS
jgi:hypothetical protein